MEEKKPELDGEEAAAAVLLGEDPTKDWTPEQRKEVEEIFKTLEKPPEPEKVDMRKHFKAGEIIKDPNGIRIAVRSVGQGAMCVQIVGKQGKFANGHYVNIGDHAFMTTRAKKGECVFEYLGPAMPVTAPVKLPEVKKEESTAATGGNTPNEDKPVDPAEGILF